MADSNNILPAWGCNICFEEPQNPVCTTCGHLFCWPCLYPWVHDMAKPCPVCRSSLTLPADIIPIYVTSQAGTPQAANAAATIPPRPHPRAPTTSVPDHDSNAAHLYRETVGDHDLNALHLYRETLVRVWQQETIERARVAGEEEGIAQLQNLIDADARSLAHTRRELKELSRRNHAFAVSSAVSGTGQLASTRNFLSQGVMDIYHAHGTVVIRRVLNAILGRRLQ